MTQLLPAAGPEDPVTPGRSRRGTGAAWAMFVLRRLVSMAVTLVILVIATFAMVQLIPGDPARRIAGQEASAETVREIRTRLGLDRPVPEQFQAYVANLLQGDLGRSFVSNQPVGELIGQRVGASASLAGVCVIIVLVISLGAGIGLASLTYGHRRPWLESAFQWTSSLMGSVPSFLSATLLIFVFAVTLRALPVSGDNQGLVSYVLPCAALSIAPIAFLTRVVRLEALDVLAQDYMRTARGKRLVPRTFYLRHLLPNVLTTSLTVSGMMLAGLIGGAVVVENVFAWPGLGSALVKGVIVKDYPVVQGITIVLGVAVVTINAIVDVVLGLVDRRSVVTDS
ncbi:ABC transporter permease [Naumannella cuiyingiana]|uniref:Peptide/nickel transport system permease protein n=1 Tax=Naumannella cuiyingiana TaxID=1347891 RepID=A0A7Z0D8K3_9ACTN|nr:ABC transporter permease [Naumannella cuiyingiana]NYI70946.1 peptide/nickel transport system permease protein [Naumannella cuiyingiana]